MRSITFKVLFDRYSLEKAKFCAGRKEDIHQRPEKDITNLGVEFFMSFSMICMYFFNSCCYLKNRAVFGDSVVMISGQLPESLPFSSPLRLNSSGTSASDWQNS